MSTVQEVRGLYAEAIAIKVPGRAPLPRWGYFDREVVGVLLAEIDRLKEGYFTEEEFQNLCHNLSVKDGEHRFKKGCEEYQKKLFGELVSTNLKG